MLVNKFHNNLCLFLIMLFVVGGCKVAGKKTDSRNSNCRKLLIFQETLFSIPQNSYFQIQIDLLKREFKLTEDVEIPRKELLFNDVPKAYIDKILEKLDSSKIVSIIDISPDKEWLSLLYKKEIATDNLGEPVFANRGFLINANQHIYNELPPFSKCYFSSDSKHCFFREGWVLYSLDLNSGETSRICDATSFFINSERSRLVVFFNGEIQLFNIQSPLASPQIMGQYRDVVVSSGIVCKEWAYFISLPSPKAGEIKLFFIDITTNNIIKVPYKLPRANLLYIHDPKINGEGAESSVVGFINPTIIETGKTGTAALGWQTQQ